MLHTYICGYVAFNHILAKINGNPVKIAHHIGTSVVVTIDPSHVKRLGIDDVTFFEEKSVENGILLEMRKFSVKMEEHNDRNDTK